MANKQILGVALAAILGLTGCNTSENRERIEAGANLASQSIERAQRPAEPFSHNPLVVTDKVWAGSAAVRMRNGQPLPERVERPRAITFAAAEPVGLNDLLSAISGQTSIPIRLGVGSESVAGRSMPVNYEGSLSGLLNQIANYYGVNWRYDGATVSLSRFETRVFMVESLPGSSKFTDEISGDSESSSSSGGGGSSNALTQETSLEAELDFWDEIKEGVDGLLGGEGSAVVAESSGTITVTTSAEKMKTIAAYLEQQNQMLSRQLAINVEVYTVDLGRNEDFSMTLDAVFRDLRPFMSSFSGAAVATSAIPGGSGSLSSVVLDMREVGQVNTVSRLLNSISDRVRMSQFPMTTLNNRPVARRIGTDTNYVASSSTTTSDGVTSTTITPSTVREGFTMQLTPRMLQDGRILMQYSLSLQDLLSLDTFTSGTSSVQLPRTSSRVFVQQSMLRSGETLLLAGYGQDDLRQDSRGVGNPFNYLLGGGTSSRDNKQMLFIAITPQEIDVRKQDAS